MDLGAFLEPGLYPVYLSGSGVGAEPWGHVFHRPGRPLSWLCQDRHPSDKVLALCLELPGMTELPDGTLAESAGRSASVCLVGEVSHCRPFAPSGPFVLRFRSLARLLG
jgi:hypothetical protein